MNFQLRGFDVTPVSGRCVLVRRVPDPRALKIEGLKPSHLRYQYSATSVVPPGCHSRCREGDADKTSVFRYRWSPTAGTLGAEERSGVIK